MVLNIYFRGANRVQLGITAWIPFQPVTNYLSLTLRDLGYTVFEANMLAIPGYVLFTINVRYLFLTLVHLLALKFQLDSFRRVGLGETSGKGFDICIQ